MGEECLFVIQLPENENSTFPRRETVLQGSLTVLLVLKGGTACPVPLCAGSILGRQCLPLQQRAGWLMA